MRIINVLEIINGIPERIESFAIYEEQFSQDIVERAEQFFMSLAIENGYMDFDNEFILDEGNYDDGNGYEIYLIWSEIN